MKTTYKQLLVMVMLLSSSIYPSHCSGGAVRTLAHITHKHVTKKRVLQAGAVGIAVYALKKATPFCYKKYTQWKSAREKQFRDQALQDMRDLFVYLRKLIQPIPAQVEPRQEPAILPAVEPTPAPVPAPAEHVIPEPKPTGNVQVTWVTVTPEPLSLANSSEVQTPHAEAHTKPKPATSASDEKRLLHALREEQPQAPTTIYGAYSEPVNTQAERTEDQAALQDLMNDLVTEVERTNHPQEAAQGDTKVVAAEQIAVPLDDAQKTIFALYNQGREYVHAIYQGRAETVPQQTLAEFENSLRAIMWFMYIAGAEKINCYFEEGTFVIHDSKHMLYNFFLSHGFAKKRISTHFNEHGKENFGIDVLGLPTDKQHILFGPLKQERLNDTRFFIKLENFGVGLTGIIPHGWEAFVAYVRKVKWIREKTSMVSDDHPTFRKERVPEAIADRANRYLDTFLRELPSEWRLIEGFRKNFKNYGINNIVSFFECFEQKPEIKKWLDEIKAAYPDWKSRKGNEVILRSDELLAKPSKDPSMHVIVCEE